MQPEEPVSDDERQRRSQIVKAWQRWLILYLPLMSLILSASIWFDFNLIMSVLMAVLAGTLLYQRYIKNRSWRSIMWGVHAKDG